MAGNVDQIKVMIADDEPMVRAGLQVILGGQPEITIVGEAANGEEAVRVCRSINPSVIVMDTSMPIMDGFRATSIIRGLDGRHSCQVIIHSNTDCDQLLFRALRAGALGFVPKDSPPSHLVRSIHQVRAGHAALSIQAVTRLVDEFSRTRALFASDSCFESLSPREHDVLKLVMQGLRCDEIAAKLTLSPSTVKSHLRSICQKLQVRDRAEVIISAYNADTQHCSLQILDLLVP